MKRNEVKKLCSAAVLMGISSLMAAQTASAQTAEVPKTPESKEVTPPATEVGLAEKGWRAQITGDWFYYTSTYQYAAMGDVPEISGDKVGSTYGATVSIGLPKWKDTSWLDFSYRSGDLKGDLSYESPTAGFGTSEVKTDLSELELRWRTSTAKVSYGVGFIYQNWDSTENVNFVSPVRHEEVNSSVNNYLVNVYLGTGHIWPIGDRFGIGLRADLGGGMGYQDNSGRDLEDSFLLDATGSACGILKYSFPIFHSVGTAFAEGGYKGTYYYAVNTAQEGGRGQWESQWLYGPYVRLGLSFRF